MDGSRGLGTHCGDRAVQGLWSEEQASWHVNRLELRAVTLALEAFLSSLPRGVIRVRSGNPSVVSYINRQGGTGSRSLSLQAEGRLLWAHAQGLTLAAIQVRGAANVLADALSRSHMVVPSEWTLSHRVLAQGWLRFSNRWWIVSSKGSFTGGRSACPQSRTVRHGQSRLCRSAGQIWKGTPSLCSLCWGG
jgi:hypothetical protein